MVKPHLYRHAGRWFCRLDVGALRRLGPGRSTPAEAYTALSPRFEFWLYDAPAHRPVRDATIA